METITNAQRVETLTELRTQVQNEMDYCTRQIEMPALLRCNCIVATADAEYQVTVNDETHKAEILIGNYHEPCFFTEKMATKVATEINLKPGRGTASRPSGRHSLSLVPGGGKGAFAFKS